MNLNGKSTNGDYSPLIDGNGNKVSYHLPLNKLGTEVQTILKVIDSIFKSKSQSSYDGDEEEFVRNLNIKFNRFESFKDQLEEIYKEHAVLYGYDYELAKNSTGMDEFYFKECYVELRRLSKDALQKNDNDPLKALDFLTDKFYLEFSTSDHEIEFSKPAIRYFLIKELVACNVFPNIVGV